MSYQKKSLRLYYREGTSDKEYIAVIEQSGTAGAFYDVYGLSGRRGCATVRRPKNAAASKSTAEAAWRMLVEDKRKTGYTTESHGRPHSGIDYGDAIEVPGASAPAAPAAVPPGTAAGGARLPVPQEWLFETDASLFESLLDHDAFAMQQVCAGTRVFVNIPPAGSATAYAASSVAAARPRRIAVSTKALTAVVKLCGKGTIVDAVYDEQHERLCVVDVVLGQGFDERIKPLLNASKALIAATHDAAYLAPLAITANDKAQLACVGASDATTLFRHRPSAYGKSSTDREFAAVV